MYTDAALVPLAHQQHGLVTTAQAAALGIDRAAAARRVRSGRWQSVHRGVYVVNGAPPTFEQQVMAACLATGGVASHRTALALWGVDPPEQVIEVTLERSHGSARQDVVVHRSKDLRPEWVVTRSGIPVTNALRLLADIGAVCPWWYTDRWLEHAVVARAMTFNQAVGAYFQLSKQGRNGVGALRDALERWAHRDVQPDSVLEIAFARLCDRYQLPRPHLQYELVVGGRRRRIDAAWPDHMVAVEVDGFSSRVDRSRFQDDRHRQNDLIAAGWTVPRFTWQDVTRNHGYVGRTLRGVLGKVGRGMRD